MSIHRSLDNVTDEDRAITNEEKRNLVNADDRVVVIVTLVGFTNLSKHVS